MGGGGGKQGPPVTGAHEPRWSPPGTRRGQAQVLPNRSHPSRLTYASTRHLPPALISRRGGGPEAPPLKWRLKDIDSPAPAHECRKHEHEEGEEQGAPSSRATTRPGLPRPGDDDTSVHHATVATPLFPRARISGTRISRA